MMAIFLLPLLMALMTNKYIRRMKCLVSSNQFMTKMWKFMVFQSLDLIKLSLIFRERLSILKLVLLVTGFPRRIREHYLKAL